MAAVHPQPHCYLRCWAAESFHHTDSSGVHLTAKSYRSFKPVWSNIGRSRIPCIICANSSILPLRMFILPGGPPIPGGLLGSLVLFENFGPVFATVSTYTDRSFVS